MMARAAVASGMVAVEVISPARPRSSSSARCTASSIASGERKASGLSRERAVVMVCPSGDHGLDVARRTEIELLRDLACRSERGHGAMSQQRLLGGIVGAIMR